MSAFLALIAVNSREASAQSTPVTARPLPEGIRGVVQTAQSDSSGKVRRLSRGLMILGRDSIRLVGSDTLGRIDLWLGHQYDSIGRIKEAESAYVRSLPKLSDSTRAYVQERLRRNWGAQRDHEFAWAFWPLKPALVWLSDWPWLAEALWIIGSIVVFGLWWRARQKGKNQLRIQPFTRDLPSGMGLGIERTIGDFHNKTVHVSLPVGILRNSGLKLPVIATTSTEELVELVEIIGPPSWIPKILERVMRTYPRFVISGHAQGTSSAVRVVAALEDGGHLVRLWDQTFPLGQLIDQERALGCQIIYALSEHPQ